MSKNLLSKGWVFTVHSQLSMKRLCSGTPNVPKYDLEIKQIVGFANPTY